MLDFLIIALVGMTAAVLAVLFKWNRVLKRRLNLLAQTCKDTQSRNRTILESVDDAFILYDPEADVITDFNPILSEMFGYSPDEISERKLQILYNGAEPYSFKDGLARHQKAWSDTPQVFEWLTRDRSGQDLWVEVRVKSVFLPERKCLLFLIKNITERKTTETRLYRLINIVEQIGEGVATADLNGIITYANQAWSDMHGYSPPDPSGQASRHFS